MHKMERTSVLHFQNVGGNSTHCHCARCDLATAHGCAKSSGGVTGHNWNGGSTIDHEMVASVQLFPSAQPPPHEGRQHQRTRMIRRGLNQAHGASKRWLVIQLHELVRYLSLG